jgi:hypothetical protein
VIANKKAVNIVSGLKGETYEKLEELRMLSLEERPHQGDMEQVYKILNGHNSVDKGQWFRLASDSTVQARLTTSPLTY